MAGALGAKRRKASSPPALSSGGGEGDQTRAFGGAKRDSPALSSGGKEEDRLRGFESGKRYIVIREGLSFGFRISGRCLSAFSSQYKIMSPEHHRSAVFLSQLIHDAGQPLLR